MKIKALRNKLTEHPVNITLIKHNFHLFLVKIFKRNLKLSLQDGRHDREEPFNLNRFSKKVLMS